MSDRSVRQISLETGTTKGWTTAGRLPERRLHRILLSAGFFLFLLINLVTIENGHNWGGDFAQYLIHASNLLNGREYGEGIVMNQRIGILFPNSVPLTCPPGFPVILTPCLWAFGLDFRLLKLPNIFFWALWCWVVMGMVRRRLGDDTGLWACLLLLFSPWFFLFKQEILSDVSFLFFTTWAVSIYDRKFPGEATDSWLGVSSFLTVAGVALLIRPAGVALFLAAACHFLLTVRNFRLALATIGAMLGILVLQESLGISNTSTYIGSGRSQVLLGTFTFFLGQASYNMEQLRAFFCHPKMVLSAFLTLPILLLALIGVIGQHGRRVYRDFLFVYAVVYLVMLLIPGRQGPRYILPVIPIFLIRGLEGLQILIRHTASSVSPVRLTTFLLILGLAHNGILIGWHWNKSTDEILQPNVKEMTEWVRKTIPLQEHYLFFKPRPLALLTGRTGLFMPNSPEAVIPLCQSEGVKWVILKSGEQDDFIQFLRNVSRCKEIWRNKGFVAFAVENR